MKVFILCGGYYDNFSYPKSFTKINGECLVDRTIRLLSQYQTDPTVCCNKEEILFDKYKPFKANFTFNYLNQTGYYLDLFDAVPFDKPCIYLFGDVYYTENAIKRIIDKFNNTSKNIFICNAYPFNEKHLRQGEPFGWIVKDQDEFKFAVKLCKKLEDKNKVQINSEKRPASNWELSQIINGNGINDFLFDEEDCLVINDLTIDIDDPSVIKKVEKDRKDN